jgi:hypothetical protein
MGRRKGQGARVEKHGIWTDGGRICSVIGRLLLVLAIFAVAIACGKSSAPAPPPVVHKIGEGVPVGDLLLTVNALRYPTSTPFTEPDPGKKFLGVDVTIKNTGSKRAHVFSRDMLFLKDGKGQRYIQDPTATSIAGTSPPDGDPFPGQEIHGTAGYQVPEDATGFQLIVDTTIMNQKFLVGGPPGNHAVIALR